MSTYSLPRMHFELLLRKALPKNTGARGLRSILESILTEAMFEAADFNVEAVSEEDVQQALLKMLEGTVSIYCKLFLLFVPIAYYSCKHVYKFLSIANSFEGKALTTCYLDSNIV
ncbi:uncharacterized protein LOC125821927 [Solanum verrucosum]|uniref:uncharacterized protein LOC125821927 n=1 Tax=Solanum verrucosum TaxID=315347 RepID=UPI0020CFF8CE|nr:uncharacterized protein LOC125821927 [Solanum verrucosum]